MSDSLPEPWLRGILPGLDPVTAHLLRAAEQICEDSAGALASLSQDQLWWKSDGVASAGFHAKHLAGSTNRLCTYLEGLQLNAPALEAIEQEGHGNESPGDLRVA